MPFRTVYAPRQVINTVVTRSGGGSSTVIPDPPGQPTALSAVSVSSTRNDLTWAAPSSGGTPTGYIVERQLDAVTDGLWREVGRVRYPATSYGDTRARPGEYHRYRVRAWNRGGTSLASATDDVTAAARTDASAPPAPTALSAEAASDTTAHLEWSVSQRAAEATETGFKVQRSPDGSSWSTIATVPRRCTWYWDSGLSASTTYHYRVRATNSAGDSDPTSTDTTTTLSSGNVLCPTGRNPQVIWTPQWHLRWTQAKADYDANPSAPATWAGKVYKQLKARADAAAGTHFNDQGRSAAMIYTITGNSAYFTIAYNYIRDNTASLTLATYLICPDSRNTTREDFIDQVWMFDWLWQGASSGQRAEMLAAGNLWADCVLHTDVYETASVAADAGNSTTQFKTTLTQTIRNFYSGMLTVTFTSGALNGTSKKVLTYDGYSGSTKILTMETALPSTPANGVTFTIGYTGSESYGGTAPDDSDENAGHTLGLLLWDLVSAAFSNPRAGTFYNATQQNAAALNIGGFTPTARNNATNRNALSRHIAAARGGTWIEASHYNEGTVCFFGIGILALAHAAKGSDYAAEAYQLLEEIGEQFLTDITPDEESRFPWGDLENGNVEIVAKVYQQTLGVYAGLLRGRPVANYLYDFSEALWDIGTGLDPWNNPFFRFWLLLDPYHAQTDHTTWRKSHLSDGHGVLYARDDPATSTASLFGTIFQQNVGVHHPIQYFGDFLLWRKGEPVVDSPQGYSGQAIEGERANCMLLGGLSSQFENRGVLAGESSDGLYHYLCGGSHGHYYPSTVFNRPQPYVNEYVRSVVYLPSTDRSCDVILVFDRGAAVNLKLLPDKADYGPFIGAGNDDETRIDAAGALFEWIFHLPTNSPTLGSGYTQWTTSGGQNVRFSHLLPVDVVRGSVLDEASGPLAGGTWVTGSRKYQIRLRTATAWPSNTINTLAKFLNVVSVWDSSQPTVTLSQGGDGRTAGALVTRAGHNDTLVLFGAHDDERTHRASFSATWTASAATTRVLLFDLDTTASWTLAVDGGGSSPLTVSDQGVASFTVAGASLHTIAVSR